MVVLGVVLVDLSLFGVVKVSAETSRERVSLVCCRWQFSAEILVSDTDNPETTVSTGMRRTPTFDLVRKGFHRRFTSVEYPRPVRPPLTSEREGRTRSYLRRAFTSNPTLVFSLVFPFVSLLNERRARTSSSTRSFIKSNPIPPSPYAGDPGV